jgi:hypothetical protein
MRSGDHIYVDRGAYTHHGIYISKQQVIHFADGRICSTTPAAFAKDDEGQPASPTTRSPWSLAMPTAAPSTASSRRP